MEETSDTGDRGEAARSICCCGLMLPSTLALPLGSMTATRAILSSGELHNYPGD